MKLPRLRFAVRRMAVAVALSAVVFAGYVDLVERQARRRRFLQADRAVAVQIDLLRCAAAMQRSRQGAEADRAAKNREQAEEAEPAAAALWAKAADEALRGAERAALRADRYQKAADDLAALRLEAGGRFEDVIRLGAVSSAWLATDDVLGDAFPPELLTAKVIARIEHSARAGGRSTFPTMAGPKASVFEATAIWLAEQSVMARRPAVRLDGRQAEATQTSADDPFRWKVMFIDPRTGKSDGCHISFSESSVASFLANNP